MNYTDENDFFDDGTTQRSNRVYLDLRAGYIAQTQKVALDENAQPVQRDVDKWTAEGYKLESTTNKAKKVSWFMAKMRNPISGYVTDLRWYSNELRDQGVTLTGWKVTIETPTQTYQLQIGSKDRAFSSFMNAILNADLSHTIKFNGFKAESKKYLLLYRGNNAGKDYIQGKYKMCFQSLLLQEKLAQNVPLTEQERKNVMFDESGAVKQDYPYIVQLYDETWDFNKWNSSLMKAINKFIIPKIEEENLKRGTAWKQQPADNTPEFAGAANGNAAPSSFDDLDAMPSAPATQEYAGPTPAPAPAAQQAPAAVPMNRATNPAADDDIPF